MRRTTQRSRVVRTTDPGRARTPSAYVLGGGLVFLCVSLVLLPSCSSIGEPGGPAKMEERGGVEETSAESGSKSSGIPYIRHQWVQAPKDPPGLRVEGDTTAVLPMVSVDWDVLDGPFEEPGNEVDWSAAVRRTVDSDVTLELDTERIPTRVVVYSYPGVGQDGVPEEESGTESPCSFEGNGANVCEYHGDGTKDVRILVDSPSPGSHLVVHAAWPTESAGQTMDVVSASWLLRPDE